ncbi:protein LSM14 homolog B-like isoform X2 [Dysidea avara]|uniref:protein LSM14 homolog B-like isoform X2 n=1 Tax=Dysidea avara TaxID=196820 RepID=UPI003324C8D7
MSNTTPYIGSKISLISKAEIRYEGILYGIDANESTVTLAKVTSFGTEDRNAPKRIPAGNEVYEYIIFRGSDIKDLHVKPIPPKDVVVDDPAIVSSGPGADVIPTPNMPPPPPSSFQAMPLVPPPDYNQISQGQPPLVMPPLPPTVTTSDGVRVEQLPISVAAVTSTPTNVTINTTSGNSETTAASTTVTTTTTTSTKTPDDGTVAAAAAAKSNKGHKGHPQVKPNSQSGSQTRTSSQPADGSRSNKTRRNDNSTSDRRHNYPSQYYSRSGGGGYDDGYYYYDDNYYGNQRYSAQQGWGYRGSRGSRGGRYQTGGRQQSSSRGGSSQAKSTSANASKKPIKFDGDFDFESSNAKFKKDQMEEEFKQMKLVDGRKESDSDVQNQEDEDVIIDEVEEGEVVESTTTDPGIFYDSSKSFFDNISCEANKTSSDRRPTRNEERTLNSETFGFSNPRGPRSRGRSRNYGSYQNQGSYYYQGRGRGGYRRGGQYYNASRPSNPRGRSRSTQDQS